jgi:16S rRNA (cytosine1402-N4)-methyltransferase
MHVPVLLHESIEQLDPQPGDLVVDGTLGLGGHAREILPRIAPGGTLLGIDLDPTRTEGVQHDLAREVSSRNLDVALDVRHGSYAELPALLADLGRKADGLLVDLGFASDQLEGERGFSFMNPGPLQMTYDPGAPSLASKLKSSTEGEIGTALRDYGGERYWKRIARSIVLRAKAGEMQTTADLRDAVTEVVPRPLSHGGIHPATRTFQALRIWANRELESLAALLGKLPDIANPGARVAIISFHSLEDAAVRTAFRDMAKAGLGKAPQKPTEPKLAEVVANPRSRSAKLRTFTFNR